MPFSHRRGKRLFLLLTLLLVFVHVAFIPLIVQPLRFQKAKASQDSMGSSASPTLPTCSTDASPSLSGSSHLVTTPAVHSESADSLVGSVSLVQETNHVAVGKTFTDEQLKLFQRRYEERYNIYIDMDYVRWLELYHPETLPDDRSSLTQTVDQSISLSVADHSLSIAPEVPLTVVHPDSISTGGDNAVQPTASEPPDTLQSTSDQSVISSADTREQQSKTPTSEQSVFSRMFYLIHTYWSKDPTACTSTHQCRVFGPT